MISMNLMPILRSARPDDIRAVRLLLQSCRLPDAGIESQFGEAFIVAEHEGQIIGVAGTERHGDYGLLRSVAVTESFRGKSVGRLLVEECVARAKERGVAEIYLLATDARGYFETLGFVAINRNQVPLNIAESPEYSSLCPKTATVMVLSSPRFRPAPRANPRIGERT